LVSYQSRNLTARSNFAQWLSRQKECALEGRNGLLGLLSGGAIRIPTALRAGGRAEQFVSAAFATAVLTPASLPAHAPMKQLELNKARDSQGTRNDREALPPPVEALFEIGRGCGDAKPRDDHERAYRPGHRRPKKKSWQAHGRLRMWSGAVRQAYGRASIP
jgi:hypothetical protein